MSIRWLSGREPAARRMEEIRKRVRSLGRPPRLLVVRAGEDAASAQYVRSIVKAAERAGIEVGIRSVAADSGFSGFCAEVVRGAAEPGVDGVQIQKPIPEDRRTSEVIELIDPRKDVEGVHPWNIGLLALGRPRFVPCTPAAVMTLLQHHEVDLRGKRAVVIGRSDIVGKPLAALLLEANATVTVCHSITADLEEEVRRAQVVIAAAGQPELVKAEWVRGAVVVDVGHHVLPDGRTAGDVEAAAAETAAALSPVPGGVGPLTVAELLRNVALAAAAPR